MTRELHIYLDGEPLQTTCRLHLRGRNEMTLNPTVFQLDLYLPSENIIGQLSSGRKIAVHSTFDSVLATGTILDVLSDTRDGKQITSVIFSDGIPFTGSFVSASFPADTSLKTITESLLYSSSVPLPLAGFTARDRTYSLGTSFFGSAADSLQSLAVDLHTDVFMFRSAIYMLGRATTPDIIDLTPEDVLDAVSSGKDVRILTTSMKGWPIGSILRYRQKPPSMREVDASAAGRSNPSREYSGQLICQTFDADTGEGPWSTRIILQAKEAVSLPLQCY